jgi:hypothetical protein
MNLFTKSNQKLVYLTVQNRPKYEPVRDEAVEVVQHCCKMTGLTGEDGWLHVADPLEEEVQLLTGLGMTKAVVI